MPKQFEYLVVDAEQKPQVALEELGKNGWDLVFVKESFISGSVSFILWLKREIS